MLTCTAHHPQISEFQNLSGEAAEAQEYLAKLPARITKLAERAQTRKKKDVMAPFSWVFEREVLLN